MSFWEKVKSAASSAKCLAGFHGGEYSHIEGQPECHLEKRCPDCKEYVTKKRHKFSDWRYTNNSLNAPCDSVRECIYCGDQEIKIIHQFEKDGKDSDCRIIEKCKRCGEEKLGQQKHNWVSIMGHDIKLQGQRKCKDCGYMESK